MEVRSRVPGYWGISDGQHFLAEKQFQLETGPSKDVGVVSEAVASSGWLFWASRRMHGKVANQGTVTEGLCPRHGNPWPVWTVSTVTT